MSKSLLSFAKEQLSNAAISKIGNLIGTNQSATRDAVNHFLPRVLKAVVNRGDTKENASDLSKFITNQSLDGNVLNKFINMSNGKETDNFLNVGEKATDYLFGNTLGNMTDKLKGLSQLSGVNSSKLLNILSPLALNFASGLAKSNNLDNVGFASYLNKQKDSLRDSTVIASSRVQADHVEASSSGLGWLKWLLPLLIIGAALWYFTKDGCQNKTSKSVDTVEHVEKKERKKVKKEATTTVTNNPETKTISADQFTIDTNGNIVDNNGNVIHKTGEYSEIDGYYVDSKGRRIGLIAKIGKAIGTGVKKTAGAFTNLFNNMFKNKEKVGSTYMLSRIVFDKESHRITTFSKNEVEGLASALKNLPGAKIQVQVHSNDESDDKQNNEVTKLRAEVVRDMLVTLGVNKKQVTFKGMGSSHATKSVADRVEIMVEQTVD